MQTIVDLMAGELTCPLVANRGSYGQECVEYTFNTTYFNGARREARMKLNIMAASMQRGMEIETMLDHLLVTKRETPLTSTVTRCVRNGGGWLTDGDMHIRIAYYDITIRENRTNTEGGMNNG